METQTNQTNYGKKFPAMLNVKRIFEVKEGIAVDVTVNNRFVKDGNLTVKEVLEICETFTTIDYHNDGYGWLARKNVNSDTCGGWEQWDFTSATWKIDVTYTDNGVLTWRVLSTIKETEMTVN